MAEVWSARRRGNSVDVVALKRIRDGANDDDKRRFAEEIKVMQKLTALKHPHIVPLIDHNEHDGRLYFTMKMMWGGSLAEKLEQFRSNRGHAAKLMMKVAMAAHVAHEHGILHRDLKPSNILLDEDDNPYIADFGVAKRVDREDKLTQTGEVVGALRYMAPEQLYGDSHSLTAAADIYSLGVTLYELTTPPKESKSSDVRVDPDLAAIYLTCLQHNPRRRYWSAKEMARDLQLYVEGKRLGRIQRMWRWSRTHQVATGLIWAALAFLLILTSSVFSLMREQESVKREQIRQVNMSSAAMVAGTMLSQLRALSDAVERTAAKDELIQALQADDTVALGKFCHSTFEFYEDPSHGLKLNENSPFHMWYVLDKGGLMRALGGKEPATVVGVRYEWRDYFKGAMKLAEKKQRSSYVSRAFWSENHSGNYRFSISSPIYAADGQPLGVLVAAVPTARTLGSLVVHDTHSITVLAAPRDRNRDSPLPVSSHLLFLHPEYASGEATPIDNGEVRRLDEVSRDERKRIDQPLGLPPPNLVLSSDDYEDPVGKGNTDPKLGTVKPADERYAGRYLAGFAPVGNTGFVVIVQTRADEAMSEVKTFAIRFTKWTGIASAPGVALAIVAAGLGRRRRIRR